MKNKMKVEEILITDIITEGQQIRYSINDDRIVELAMSINAKGLLEPIVVQPLPDGKYQLLAGSRRVLAFRRLKSKTIPAVLRKDDGTPIKTLALIENVMQEPMTLAEEVEAVKHLYDVEKQSPGMICETTGKGKNWVDQRLAIPYLHKEVYNELLDGRISLGHAEIINAVEEESMRSLLLNNVLQQKLTKRQTKELATLYKAAPSMDSAIKEGLKKEQELSETSVPQRACDSCGAVKPINEITLVAVCAAGCAQPVLPEMEENNAD